MPDRRRVVLVDAEGEELETSDKRYAHEPPGRLHRAFSVFLFAGDEAMLVQQRASSKYHFPGVWANACCSHPEPGEELVSSARRRVAEELGIIPVPELHEVGTFTYRAVDPVSGLVEHEYDHVLVGVLPPGTVPSPDPAEVQACELVAISSVRGAGPAEGYSPWFAEALEVALSGLSSPASTGSA